ncbi:hypothetical protein AAFF_G00112460 [Aldrovandia affinis]|uniref:Homologous recombination OB-fold protein OB-fold domain-containing protein n=1 Tax=Aldrovandia affinis TaxID=143900 RepID=A0AAD7RVU8_9TELE|nr:hypothetical protein AAFF_G00112460 [Aldrovandia affinis]
MAVMACKWNGLFNVGEDFDDEADWDVTSDTISTTAVPVTSSSSRLRASTATSVQAAVHTPLFPPPTPHIASHTSLEKAPGSASTVQDAVEKIVFKIKCLSSSAVSSVPSCPSPFPNYPKTQGGTVGVGPSVISAPAQSNPPTDRSQLPDSFPDDFDDWDVDLQDLDDAFPQKSTGSAKWQPTVDSMSPAKKMRLSNSWGQAQPCGHLPFATGNVNQTVSALDSRHSFSVPSCSSVQISASPNLRTRAPLFCRGGDAPSSTKPGHVPPRPMRKVPQWQMTTPTSCLTGQAFSTPYSPLSPLPSVRASGAGSPSVTPRSLHTPVFTNHLAQLVSAANKMPQKSRLEPLRSKTRRFPGPAGLLPQQLLGQSLDDIVVSVPQTPVHGAMARLRHQVHSSQVSEEEELSGGPWAKMKAEMGLDERNPACFLHSYSVVMVLRKAVLKQLAKNKVPNMAVMVKTLMHTHADAKAVFRDHTGEIQGTVHRHLLEDRQGELKTGAVLLLKQVGVFSPSHRNHYLNVTPNNLLKIYPPDGATWSSTKLSHYVLEEPMPQHELASNLPGDPTRTVYLGSLQGCGRVEDLAWEADDLDKLLGELPEDSYIL